MKTAGRRLLLENVGTWEKSVFMCVGVTGGVAVFLADVERPRNMIGLTLGQPGHPTHVHQPRVSCNNVRGRLRAQCQSYGWFRLTIQSWPSVRGSIMLHVWGELGFFYIFFWDFVGGELHSTARLASQVSSSFVIWYFALIGLMPQEKKKQILFLSSNFHLLIH